MLLLGDGQQQILAISEIEARSQPTSTMPAMGKVINARDLRDLLEYLAALK